MTDSKAGRKPAVRPQFLPMSILRTLWKRKISVLLCWVTVSAGAASVVRMLPSIYRSDALILVESQRIPERFVAATVNTDLQDRLSTISQQVLSYSRLQDLVDKFGLYEEERRSRFPEQIIETMRKDISLAPVRGGSRERPSAFRIAYQGRNPQTVAAIANQLASYFIEENLRSREVQAAGTSEFIQNQLVEAKKRLEEQEAKLKDFKLRYNGELPQQENALIAKLGQLQLRLAGAQDALGRAQQQKTMLDSSLEVAEASAIAFAQLARQRAAGSGLERTTLGSSPDQPNPIQVRKTQLIRMLQTLQVRYQDDHPDVQSAKRELDRLTALEAATAAARKEVAPNKPAVPAEGDPDVPPGVAEAAIREKGRVERIKTESGIAAEQIKAVTAERTQLVEDIKLVQARIEQLPIREEQLTAVVRDYEMSKANYQSLMDKRFSAEMAADMERRGSSERFSLIDPARVSELPVKPKRGLLLTIGSLAGLLAGVGLGFVKELKTNSVLGEWELPEGTPVLARIPTIRNRSGDPQPT